MTSTVAFTCVAAAGMSRTFPAPVWEHPAMPTAAAAQRKRRAAAATIAASVRGHH